MESKYQKVVQYIKNEVDNGNLKPGRRLPSIRKMSEDFGCNKATIIRAYSELERDHLLYSKPKSGYYVVENRGITKKYSSISDIIDFSPASPDIEALPYLEFQHSINQAIDIYKDSLFSYSDPQGILNLRKSLQKYLQNFQVFTSSDRIFITTGSQQALFILAAMPFPNGKCNVLVEQPTFTGMIKALEINNITTLGIERTSSGINPEELERIFKNGNIKFFYTIPRFHNPTGFSYSNEQKLEILRLAQKYDVFIVEDDYLAELEPDTKADPIYAFDETSRVIYVKSFSKTLLPGLRIASLALPELLVNTFRDYKKSCDLNTSVLSQGALEIYLKSGMFENHVKKIKCLYQERMSELSKASEELQKLGVSCHVPISGFFAYFEFPEGIKSYNLVNSLNVRNVYTANADLMFLPSFRKGNAFRLSICKVDEEKIKRGVGIICDEIKNMKSICPVHRKSDIEL